ncbi:MAG: adenosylhomocysteinase [Candidatus Aminicenantes bacterium]|nr:adenosylhomocysteinase [Candidatus Aminicenantes bacterium]
MNYDIKDINFAEQGKQRMEWAARFMPVLADIKNRFKKEKPLKGLRISACLHVTSETANLMETIKEGGARVTLTASNPLSTQDDIAAALVKFHEIPVFSINGEDNETYYRHINQALDNKPHITMDDGADLVSTIHSQRKELLKDIIGGTEETTTGVIRLKSMAAQKVLNYPIIAVNDANTKHLFDNRYGTGQSTIDGILRSTNILLAGTNFVVSGYGWCGRGVATRARGAGAKVIICEVDPLRALEAVMDGFQVMPLIKASEIGDIFVTVTGDKNVISEEHFNKMKDGAIVANAGHFNVEIDIPALNKISKEKRNIKKLVEEFTLGNGRKIFLLAEGRLLNLSAAEGHPASVMDMSFANQALSVVYLSEEGKGLMKKVYPVPKEIDEDIALRKLRSMNIQIDSLTEEQKSYLAGWEEGT